jgi:ABC-type phosphate/phosphonate transport system substrate-binding protein
MLKRVLLSLGMLCFVVAIAIPADAAKRSTKSQPVRIGAVAYAPGVVTVFNGIKQYLNKNGFAADYVLYSNYDALVAALKKGEVDIAWNTPLAHAKYHVASGGKSKTLVMRDVDRGVRAVVVARVDSGIESAKELPGRKLIIGSRKAAEATVLPLYYLKKQGVDVSAAKTLCLDGECDFNGNPCCSPQHVLAALQKGRGEAGVIRAGMWRRIAARQKKTGKADLRLVWTSPAFNHCVFTAPANFDEAKAKEFTRLMLAMDPKDPATADVLRLEGAKRWIRGTSKGFEDLILAVGGK